MWLNAWKSMLLAKEKQKLKPSRTYRKRFTFTSCLRTRPYSQNCIPLRLNLPLNRIPEVSQKCFHMEAL